MLAGSAFSKTGGATLVLSGANIYTGATTVNEGTLVINGVQTAATGATTVASGATLAGSGTLGGALTIEANGHLSPGSAIGTLTVPSLVLNPGSVLNIDRATPSGGGGDLVRVTGDITLGGRVDLGNGLPPGSYLIISYGGNLTNQTMVVGNLPGGMSASEVRILVDTNAKKVFLVYGPAGNYWDAATATKDDSNINGGTGDWTAAISTNWTTSAGTTNGSWLPDAVALFGGTAGTVTVDSSFAPINIAGLGFTTTGYAVNSGTLTATATSNTLTAAPNVSATINSVLAGSGKAFTKEGAGTITLGASNSYSGSTTINAGTLVLRAFDNASPTFTIGANAKLQLDYATSVSTSTSQTFNGSGTLVKTGSGETVWGPSIATFAMNAGSLIDVRDGTFTGGNYANDVWTNNKSSLNVEAGATFAGLKPMFELMG